MTPSVIKIGTVTRLEVSPAVLLYSSIASYIPCVVGVAELAVILFTKFFTSFISDVILDGLVSILYVPKCTEFPVTLS